MFNLGCMKSKKKPFISDLAKNTANEFVDKVTNSTPDWLCVFWIEI